MIFVIIIAVVFALVIAGGIVGALAKSTAIKTSQTGTTRVETVTASSANYEIERYAKYGWNLVDQSSAKSVLRKTQVTLRFVKQ